MPALASTVKFTYEDFLTFPEDGRRHELLDGEHLVSPSPGTAHQSAVIRLSYLLYGFVRDRRLGRVFAGPFDIVLSNHDVLEPDLLFVSNERLDRITKANVQGAPDLVVEVLSPSTKRVDLGGKLRAYEKFGVREYWVVDADAQTVRRIVFGAGGCDEQLAAGQALETSLLPGLQLPIESIFEQ